MNSVSVDLERWSNRRWFWAGTVLLILHLGLIFWFSEKGTNETIKGHSFTRLQLATTKSHGPDQSENSELNDPTLFALGSIHGFNGTAWSQAPRYAYRLTNRLGPPQWLSLTRSDLVNEFAESLQDLSGKEKEPLFLSKRWLPVSWNREPEIGTVLEPMLRIEGDLVARQLISSNSLPTPDVAVLSNSVIRVIVDARGRTFSAALLMSSGSPRTDDEALNFARRARFSALTENVSSVQFKAEEFVLGDLVFQWRAANRAQTNAAVVNP